MATLKDIAQATGLSMNTVSRAIRGSGYVSLKTAELVRKTVKELDYHPNRAAQDLRRRKSRQITVVAESYDYLHIEKLAAIKEYAANCGYTMGVHFTSEDYPQSTFSALLPDILEQNPAGGSKVKSGRTVYLTVNADSAPKVAIPDVMDNSSLRQAEAKLRALGFKITEPEYISGEKDWVYSIKYRGRDLKAGEKVPHEAVLTLTVGNGNETMPEDSALVNESGTANDDKPVVDESWF